MAGGYTPRSASYAEASWENSIQKRMRVLETQQRLVNSSIKGGAMTVYDESLDEVWLAGKAVYGTSIETRHVEQMRVVAKGRRSTMLLIDTEYGWVVPSLRYNYQPNQTQSSTSDDWATVWFANTNVIGQILRTSFGIISTDGSTNMEARVTLNNIPTPDTYTANGGAGSTTCEYRWDISGFSGFGGNTAGLVEVQIRRTAGSGTIFCFTPTYLYYSTPVVVDNATEDGKPS